jgi:catechol 2,3-dioxygenase-like lactoylglutathione lyase family enzyme
MNRPPVVFGVSHVHLPVLDLGRSRALYAGILGFEVKAQGDGWMELDAGGTVDLLLTESGRVEQRGSLRLLAPDVDATLEALLRGGCSLVHDAARTAEMTLAATVSDADGHHLTVWRALTEDEYEVPPELPTVLTWEDDAQALLKQLLKGVPALFRGIARRKVVRVAEELASRQRLVTREEVIRGFILASPRVTRGRNRQPLLDAGIDPARYQEDWDAD